MSRGAVGPPAGDQPCFRMASPSKTFAASSSAKRAIFVREPDNGNISGITPLLSLPFWK